MHALQADFSLLLGITFTENKFSRYFENFRQYVPVQQYYTHYDGNFRENMHQS